MCVGFFQMRHRSYIVVLAFIFQYLLHAIGIFTTADYDSFRFTLYLAML